MNPASTMDRLVSATSLKRAIKRTLLSGPLRRAIKGSEFALELFRVVRPYGLEHFFPLLQRLGFAPRHVVDVGANRGFWTRAAFKYFRDPVYTLVEPQDHLRCYSQDLVDQGCKLNWINAGCGDFCGTLPLIVSYRDDASTFVDRHDNPTAQRITVPIITLNQLVASSGAGLPEMVKIDAEGFLRRTPGPPPFSSINSTPAASKAWRTATGCSTWRFSRSRRFGFAVAWAANTRASLRALSLDASFPARVTYAVGVEQLNFRFFWSAPRATSLI